MRRVGRARTSGASGRRERNAPAKRRKKARRGAVGAKPPGNYLNRSSKAFFALDALDGCTDDLVSRSTVVRGSKNVQVLRVSFGETRAGIAC